MHDRGPWKVIDSREVYRDPWITVQIDDVIRPDGKPGTHSIIHLKPGVCVIALDADAAVKETHMLGRAASLLAAGSKDAALEAYDKVIEANPKSIKAYIGRGNVYAAAGDRDKALAEFAAAEKIDPDDTAPHLARAEAAETWGDKQLAIENYLFVVKNNTRSAGPSRKALQRLGVDTPP